MRNQEDEMLKKCLRQTMEQIQPDEETKKRMYLEIMRRASAAENAKTAAQKKRPWYLRWQTSKPAETARAAETSKKADIVTTAAPVVTTLPETSKEQETETVPIRQNIYLYYKLIWRNNPYDTNYDEVPGGVLDNYLGYGVTQGSDVDDTYTVLIYSITGVDPRQQVAVQYVGEEKYYVFTIQ